MIIRACILSLLASVSAFQLPVTNNIAECRRTSYVKGATNSNNPLHLVPLTRFVDSISFFTESEDFRCCIDNNGYFRERLSPSASSSSSSTISDPTKNDNADLHSSYELGLVEEEELPDLCRFVVNTFGAEAIAISQDMNSFERMLMSPAAEFFNGYSGLVAFAEVFSGTRQRLLNRLNQQPSMVISAPELKGLSQKERIRKVEQESLIIVLARQTTDANRDGGDSPLATTNTLRSSRSFDVIATIELRLQPCDAKIPFSIPWLDRVERSLWNMEKKSTELQPYLSNLCVDEKFRGQKIGRGLVRCVENIAKTCWGYNRIYLHVDEDNLAALNLYKSEGYRDVGHRWNPFWSGHASKIGYYVKSLQ